MKTISLSSLAISQGQNWIRREVVILYSGSVIGIAAQMENRAERSQFCAWTWAMVGILSCFSFTRPLHSYIYILCTCNLTNPNPQLKNILFHRRPKSTRVTNLVDLNLKKKILSLQELKVNFKVIFVTKLNVAVISIQ